MAVDEGSLYLCCLLCGLNLKPPAPFPSALRAKGKCHFPSAGFTACPLICPGICAPQIPKPVIIPERAWPLRPTAGTRAAPATILHRNQLQGFQVGRATEMVGSQPEQVLYVTRKVGRWHKFFALYSVKS